MFEKCEYILFYIFLSLYSVTYKRNIYFYRAGEGTMEKCGGK